MGAAHKAETDDAKFHVLIIAMAGRPATCKFHSRAQRWALGRPAREERRRSRRASERGGHTLQTSGWTDGAHFFAISAWIMQRCLASRRLARGRPKRAAAKRSGSPSNENLPAPARESELVALDEALEALASFDQREAVHRDCV